MVETIDQMQPDSGLRLSLNAFFSHANADTVALSCLALVEKCLFFDYDTDAMVQLGAVNIAISAMQQHPDEVGQLHVLVVLLKLHMSLFAGARSATGHGCTRLLVCNRGGARMSCILSCLTCTYVLVFTTDCECCGPGRRYLRAYSQLTGESI
jgi:hypothetical protein